jgi:hypothetical protein
MEGTGEGARRDGEETHSPVGAGRNDDGEAESEIEDGDDRREDKGSRNLGVSAGRRRTTGGDDATSGRAAGRAGVNNRCGEGRLEIKPEPVGVGGQRAGGPREVHGAAPAADGEGTTIHGMGAD